MHPAEGVLHSGQAVVVVELRDQVQVGGDVVEAEGERALPQPRHARQVAQAGQRADGGHRQMVVGLGRIAPVVMVLAQLRPVRLRFAERRHFGRRLGELAKGCSKKYTHT